MDVQYQLPLTSAMDRETVGFLIQAVGRWGRQAALRIEDPQPGIQGRTAFRGRYRVGYLKGGFVGTKVTPFFIECGCGDSFAAAFANADLSRRP